MQSTRILIDNIPTSFEDLQKFDNFFILSNGQHTLYFASRDNAGNTEEIKSKTIFVDGTAPASPINPQANDSNPSPWKNQKEYNISWTNPEDISGISGAYIKYGGQPTSNDEGIFYPTTDSLIYYSESPANGDNPIWLWLKDNVENTDFSTAIRLTLRYDDILPASTSTSPEFSKESVIPITFNSWDEGAPETGSGIKETILWHKKDNGEWSSGEISISQDDTFYFDTQGQEGLWYFYTQTYDNAGNFEPMPVSTTIAKTETFADITNPTISNIKSTVVSPDTAIIEWQTDDETTAVIEYGQSQTLVNSNQLPVTSQGKTHNVTLTNLPNPSNIYFKIIAENKTGLKTESEI